MFVLHPIRGTCGQPQRAVQQDNRVPVRNIQAAIHYSRQQELRLVSQIVRTQPYQMIRGLISGLAFGFCKESLDEEHHW